MNIDKLNSIMDFAAKYIEAGYFKKKDQVYYGQRMTKDQVKVAKDLEKSVTHDPRAPKWAKELMENLIKNG